jgi:TPR repeat protein
MTIDHGSSATPQPGRRPVRRRVGGALALALALGALPADAATPSGLGDLTVACSSESACSSRCACAFQLWPEERLLLYGYGMTADPAAAAYWYRRAAEAGHAAAQFNWGVILARGRGVAADPAAAVPWLLRAAERGVAEAAYVIGNLHREGRGVAPSQAEALRWYRRGAASGQPAAELALGNMLGNGRGAPRDPIAGYAWIELAARRGYGPAQEARARAELLLGWREIMAGRRLAEALRAARAHRATGGGSGPVPTPPSP